MNCKYCRQPLQVGRRCPEKAFRKCCRSKAQAAWGKRRWSNRKIRTEKTLPMIRAKRFLPKEVKP